MSPIANVHDNVTRILSAIEQGDPSAAEQLLPLVYDELRKLAAEKTAPEKPDQTLQATALVVQVGKASAVRPAVVVRDAAPLAFFGEPASAQIQ